MFYVKYIIDRFWVYVRAESRGVRVVPSESKKNLGVKLFKMEVNTYVSLRKVRFESSGLIQIDQRRNFVIARCGEVLMVQSARIWNEKLWNFRI